MEDRDLSVRNNLYATRRGKKGQKTEIGNKDFLQQSLGGENKRKVQKEMQPNSRLKLSIAMVIRQQQ